MAQLTSDDESYPSLVWRIAELEIKVHTLLGELEDIHSAYRIPHFPAHSPSRSPERGPTREASIAVRSPTSVTTSSAMDWRGEHGSLQNSDFSVGTSVGLGDELPRLVDVYKGLPIPGAPRTMHELYSLDASECRRILLDLGHCCVGGDAELLRRTLHRMMEKLNYVMGEMSD
ncbi:hypothetical protein PT974_11197 [Cladobotryum mycophilum]|uniref:Uncharacterized protein n=1 Tax=Cladobotryum mycophilum TaxID=491253 RepID=A0ABR0S523_9HYPO